MDGLKEGGVLWVLWVAIHRHFYWPKSGRHKISKLIKGDSQVVEKTSLVVVQLIHRMTLADISCTTMARLIFFPLLGDSSKNGPESSNQAFLANDFAPHLSAGKAAPD